MHVLKEWGKKNHLSGEDQILYKNLVTRITEIMERAGQITMSSISSSQQKTRPLPKSNSQEMSTSECQKRASRNNRSLLLDLDDDILIGKFYH